MYWSRTDNSLDLALTLLLSLGWGAGGWLLARHTFHLRPRERLVTGLGLGWVLFVSLSNLLAGLLGVVPAFWAAGGLILAGGLAAAWYSACRPWLDRRDLRQWPLVGGILLVTLLYTLMLKGQAIFDEYLHLPLISIMAVGDIPPHFYLNPDTYFAYHYGIQVYAASLVRLAGFFPWSAWDISRALGIAFTLALGWVWVRRVTFSKLAAGLGALLFTFGGGARWLLTLLPDGWLEWVSQRVQMSGSGWDTAPTLALALQRNWVFEGGGNVPLPFVFHNGIFVPVNFTLGSSGALPYVTLLLLLLLVQRPRFSRMGLLVWGILFASLALSAEHLYALLWLGILAAVLWSLWQRFRRGLTIDRGMLWQWAAMLFFSAGLALIQGGFITEAARSLLSRLAGGTAHTANAYAFALRWPPGLPDAHLGTLSILNLGQLVSLLAELGPALLLVPVVAIASREAARKQRWLWAGLALSAALSLLLPLFISYGVDRSVTRFPATALWCSLVLAYPLLWQRLTCARWLGRLAAGLGYAAVILAGLVILTTQVRSMPAEMYSYFIQRVDASLSQDYWNRLPQDAQVLDRLPSRGVTLFGRISRAHSDIYIPLPEWEALLNEPDPVTIARAGFGYVYFDKAWWDELTPERQQRFASPCVDVLADRQELNCYDYRVLMDIRRCAAP